MESGYRKKVGSEAQGFCPEVVPVGSRERPRLKLRPWAVMLGGHHPPVNAFVRLVAEAQEAPGLQRPRKASSSTGSAGGGWSWEH